MSARITSTDADRELKARHRALWALGDYPAVATEVIPTLGSVLVEACGVRPGDRVLDVAAGSGNAAIPAARAGGRVVATDLTPELLEHGRRLVAGEDLPIQWQEADAEALPFADGEFDVVLSCVGVAFAPHHQEAADELLRVCRSGGTVGLVNWTPEGFIGQLFTTMKPYAPAPPPGAQPPPLWGQVDHVRSLLGEGVTDVVPRQQELVVDRFGTPEEFREFFKRTYGPTISVFRAIEDDPGRVAELEEAMVDLAARFGAGDGVMRWEYLLVTATRT